MPVADPIAQLREIGPGLKELARAIREAPPALQAAYQAGFLDGAVVGVVALLVMLVLFMRRGER